MSLFRQKRLYGINGAADLIPARPAGRIGLVNVTNDTALRHSAVWAALRLRANIISTLPVDVFRRVDGRQIEMPKPPIIVNPGGADVDWCEWMYSSQFDLDRAGNTFGLITEINSLGLPNRIDLQPLSDVSVIVRDGVLARYRIGKVEYEPSQVWHERQYTVSGLPVGLSPIMYAAWSIGQYLSIEQFALDWFGAGAVPIAHLRNTARTVPPQVATEAKEKFKASVANRDLWVSGNDWEYKPIQAESMGAEWIEAQQVSHVDIARYFDVPAGQIDAAVAGSSITYQNLTQDDLKLLSHSLNPAMVRRERRISAKLLPQPRYIKLNRDALLAIDPKGRADLAKVRIDSRTLTPDEQRELENQPPLTDEQIAQFDRLFGSKNPPPPAARAVAPPRRDVINVGSAIVGAVETRRRLAPALPPPPHLDKHRTRGGRVVGRPFVPAENRYSDDQPRDPDGKFGSGGGSEWASSSTALASGESAEIGVTKDGHVNFGVGGDKVSLDDHTAEGVGRMLTIAAEPEEEGGLEIGQTESEAFYGAGQSDSYATGYVGVTRTGEDSYELDLSRGDGSAPPETVATATLTASECREVGAEMERYTYAQHVDTDAGSFSAIPNRDGSVAASWPGGQETTLTSTEAQNVSDAIHGTTGPMDDQGLMEPEYADRYPEASDGSLIVGPDDVVAVNTARVGGSQLTVTGYGTYDNGHVTIESPGLTVKLPADQADSVARALGVDEGAAAYGAKEED